jgi:hypothetical protein
MVMAKSKPTKKTAVKQVSNLENGVVVDITQIDDSLTDKARRFVFFYCFPGTDAYQCKARAAIKAGYAKSSANYTGFKLCCNPKVIDAIKKLSGAYVSETVDNLFNRYVQSLEQRAFYDVADFYDGEQLKELDEIEPGKRFALDGIDYKGNKGDRKIFMFGDRKAALKEIRELHKETHPIEGDGYDTEETMEIIMARVTTRAKERAARVAEDAEIMREIVKRGVDVEEEL